MKGIVVPVHGALRVDDFEEPLYQTVGKVVGGYIEVVEAPGLPEEYRIICNEEGLLQGLEPNWIGSELCHVLPRGLVPIVGDIVLMKEGLVDGEPDIVGLDDEDVEALISGLEEMAGKMRRTFLYPSLAAEM